MVTWYKVTEMVVGLPRNMNNSLGGQAENILKLVEKLKKHFKLPVWTWDERLSTVAADRALEEAGIPQKKRKKVIDQIAAIVILQNYLDYKRMGSSGSAV